MHLLVVNGLPFTLLVVRGLGVGHIYQGRHIRVEVIVLLLALRLKNALGARGPSSTRAGRSGYALHLRIAVLVCVFRVKALGELVCLAFASAAADRTFCYV
jgi:hypothetical protein